MITNNKECVQYINGRLHFIQELIEDEAKFDRVTKEAIDRQFKIIKDYLKIIFNTK